MTRASRALLVLVVCLGLVSGCRPLAGRTFGGYMDDRGVSTRVKRQLAVMRAEVPDRISVDTIAGTVYLSGTVESEEVKRRVEEIARGVRGADQVVNDLHVAGARAAGSGAVRSGSGGAASPRVSVGGSRITSAASHPPNPLLQRIPGIARLERPRGAPLAPQAAYDGQGRLVATVYTVPMRDLTDTGFEPAGGAPAPVEHVSIYPVASHPDFPDPHYYVVLWHVSRPEAAALRAAPPAPRSGSGGR